MHNATDYDYRKQSKPVSTAPQVILIGEADFELKFLQTALGLGSADYSVAAKLALLFADAGAPLPDVPPDALLHDLYEFILKYVRESADDLLSDYVVKEWRDPQRKAKSLRNKR